jgi:hypothetical protein
MGAGLTFSAWGKSQRTLLAVLEALQQGLDGLAWYIDPGPEVAGTPDAAQKVERWGQSQTRISYADLVKVARDGVQVIDATFRGRRSNADVAVIRAVRGDDWDVIGDASLCRLVTRAFPDAKQIPG